MKTRIGSAAFAIALGLPLMTGLSLADPQPLIVGVDQSKILNLSKSGDTIVIGNPSIADASMQGTRLFVHGRSFGTTNLIVMDSVGTELANYELTVQLGGRYNVSVFKAGDEYSFVCAPDCEAQMHVGDQKDWFKDNVFERNKDKINLATGQKPTEVNQPQSSQ